MIYETLKGNIDAIMGILRSCKRLEVLIFEAEKRYMKNYSDSVINIKYKSEIENHKTVLDSYAMFCNMSHLYAITNADNFELKIKDIKSNDFNISISIITRNKRNKPCSVMTISDLNNSNKKIFYSNNIMRRFLILDILYTLLFCKYDELKKVDDVLSIIIRNILEDEEYEISYRWFNIDRDICTNTFILNNEVSIYNVNEEEENN